MDRIKHDQQLIKTVVVMECNLVVKQDVTKTSQMTSKSMADMNAKYFDLNSIFQVSAYHRCARK